MYNVIFLFQCIVCCIHKKIEFKNSRRIVKLVPKDGQFINEL